MSVDSTFLAAAAVPVMLAGSFLRTSLRDSYSTLTDGLRRYIQRWKRKAALACAELTDTVVSASGLEYPRLAAMGLVEPIPAKEVKRVAVPITVATRR